MNAQNRAATTTKRMWPSSYLKSFTLPPGGGSRQVNCFPVSRESTLVQTEHVHQTVAWKAGVLPPVGPGKQQHLFLEDPGDQWSRRAPALNAETASPLCILRCVVTCK